MDSIRCPQCNFLCWASDPKCKRCGLPFQASDTTAEFDVPNEKPVEAYPVESATSPQEFAPPITHHATPVSPSYAANAPKPKIRLAVLSMIFGIMGMPPFSTFGGAIVGAILAIFFGAGGFITGLLLVLAAIPAGLIAGIVSIRRSNRLPMQYGGKGFAIAGIVCSLAALFILPVIAAIAIPNLMASRRAANEGVTISRMRKLASAEDIFMKQLGAGHCGDFDVMTGTSLIDKELGKSENYGYRFVISKRPAGGCEIYASPVSASMGNRSFFYSTSDGAIRATSDSKRQAGPDDAIIQDVYSKNDELPAKAALERSR